MRMGLLVKWKNLPIHQHAFVKSKKRILNLNCAISLHFLSMINSLEITHLVEVVICDHHG